MADLFDTAPVPDRKDAPRPLADRLRPQSLPEVIGQAQVLGPEAPLGVMLAAGALGSVIFWGPPGVGKTTIARLLADETALHFVQISAIFSGVADLKKVFEAAKIRRQNGQGTLLFVDEIHRFNKAQQDGFLPHMEDGTILLVGATTENPRLSSTPRFSAAPRCWCWSGSRWWIWSIWRSAPSKSWPARCPSPARRARRCWRCPMAMARAAQPDRAGLRLTLKDKLDRDGLTRRLQRRAAQYDKSGDAHYNLISALHKSVRGSDPDAALYWFTRMLEGGEDPRFLARRITRMAVEDIGLADPQAQSVCLDSWQTYERLGSPEGELALAQAVIYLALAPKSNAAYVAYKAATRDAKQTGSHVPPKHILNAPTRLMKDQGYGSGLRL